VSMIGTVKRSRRVTIIGLLLLPLCGLVACKGGEGKSQAEPPAYRKGLPLHAEVVDGGREGPLRLERITYTSGDGQTVPALFAIPARRKPLGCLMYQGGFGQTKEKAPDVRRGAAALGLATFTIDPRDAGARGTPAQALAAIKKPETVLGMVLGTVLDLRMGLDYLQTRPECHHNIAYMGTSFGAVVGALFAGQDTRIKAVVLTSLGATFKEGMLITSAAAQQIPNVPVIVPGAATDPELLAHATRVLSPYDAMKWVGKIAPRPLMLINGLLDPIVPPIDALEIAAAAREPKTVVYFNGGHDPFAPGPDEKTVSCLVARFLSANLGLPSSC
jgi:pimeloyl-ACP methyl ester carboxylesterase